MMGKEIGKKKMRKKTKKKKKKQQKMMKEKMVYYQTKFGCKQTSTLEDIVKNSHILII